MTLAAATKKELRATFGPRWVSTLATYALIIGGLFLVGSIGLTVLGVAETTANMIGN